MSLRTRALSEPGLRTAEAVATVPVWPGFALLVIAVVDIFSGPGKGFGYLATVLLWVWLIHGAVPVGTVLITSFLRRRRTESDIDLNRLDLGLAACYLTGWLLVIVVSLVHGSLSNTGVSGTLVLFGFFLATVPVVALSVLLLARFSSVAVERIRRTLSS